MDDTQAQVIAGVVALFCWLCAGTIVLLYLRRRRKLQHWLRVEATVSRAWRERRGDAYAGGGGNAYFAEYIFTLEDGQKRQGQSRTEKEHEPNDVIEVRYDPDDPYRSQAAFTDSTLWHLVALPLAVVFVIFGGVALFDGFTVMGS